MICKKCKKKIDEKTHFCSYCGKNIKSREIDTKIKIVIWSCFILFVINIISPLIEGFCLQFIKQLESTYFIEYMENQGCVLVNTQTERQYEQFDFYYITDNDSCPYDISYSIIDTESEREEFYDEIVSKLQKDDILTTKTTITAPPNYFSFTTVGDNYKTVIMNKDSVLYLNVDSQKEATKILNDFGYNNDKIDNIFSMLKDISSILIVVLLMISWWQINLKIGRKGWICLVPIYNILCLSRDILGSKVYCALLLLPITFPIFVILLLYNIGKRFGLDEGERILLIFLFILYIPIIAFDNSRYLESIKK